MSHPHGHSGPCGHDHHHDDDSHVKPDEGEQDLLYSSIDRDRLIVLNETVPGSGAGVIKTWEARMSAEPEVVSAEDDQLLFHVPFTSSVQLSTLLIRPSSTPELTPVSIKLFKNLPEYMVTFDDIADLPPTRTTTTLDSIPTVQDTKDVISFPLQRVKWANTDSITLFIESSHGGEHSGIQFLGFKGKSSGYTRQAPQNIVYESAPQIKDHAKLEGVASGQHFGQ